MPNRNGSDLPEGLSPAAKEKRAQFNKACGDFIEQRRKEVALTILIWGPSPTSTTATALKRKQIRDELVKLGHFATFSEDLPASDSCGSAKTNEQAQASLADLIFILIEDAPGATAEVHDFSDDINIFPNMQIMVPRRYRSGYSAKGALLDIQNATGGGCVFWYAERDMVRCNILHRAITRAEALRTIRFRNKRKDIRG